MYAQDDDADEEIIQLAFALQVQALSTDESGDWSMMRFEENFVSVVEDIKKRKELNRLIEEAIKWQSVLQVDGSVGEGYSKEEYEQFLEDAKTFYIEEGGIPEDLADSPWVNIENVARDRDTITIDEAGAVKDDGWIIKDMDKSSEDKNDFLSGMFSVMDFDESLNDLNDLSGCFELFELSRVVLSCFELSRAALGCHELFRAVLSCTELSRAALGCSELF